jgi:hypothetical protein
MTEAILDEMDAVAQEAGADFIAFHIPFKGVVYAEDWGPILARLDIAPDQLDPKLVEQQFRAICERRDLACIEPTPEFQRIAAERAKSGERLYYLQDNHWNAGGHALAADLLARFIRELQNRG